MNKIIQNIKTTNRIKRKRSKREMKEKDLMPKTVEAVHTHTHTHK